jgi:outer membrane immunogenic protein
MMTSLRVILACLVLTSPAQAWDLRGPGGADGPGAAAARLRSSDWLAVTGPAVEDHDFFSRIRFGLDSEILGGRSERSDFLGEAESGGAVRARIGYAFDRFVAYGVAGVAFTSAEFARFGRRDPARRFGWVAGAGLEAALFAGVSARVEYLYVDLARDAGGGADLGFDPAGGQMRLGFNYRF